ncbi:hypothetical protein M011DRAFT_426569 [Sporormia fimetaria CBS 119925]|uniref:Uncharacterized protein n=1 Tax=Sporormia fimetaria CBS 119925 TaxID=1340428 RepID=A0A6A6V6S9_9PLEO|nr:hypothetical protein M011DRAFT_426569 [Sporormia fimetaria CBS 119925]
MMLTETPVYYQPMYTPARRSPLSERPANVPFFSMTNSSPASKPSTPTPQRTYKANPVIQNRETTTQRRRDLFFRRVQKDREDGRWSARGEQIQRLDWVTEQKRWEAEKARQAPELREDYVEEEATDLVANTPAIATASDPRSEQEIAEAEYILAQEEREFQALIADMKEEQHVPDNASQHYGSDDDDYDQIFMECAISENAHRLPGPANSQFHDGDAMDTSDG